MGAGELAYPGELCPPLDFGHSRRSVDSDVGRASAYGGLQPDFLRLGLRQVGCRNPRVLRVLKTAA